VIDWLFVYVTVYMLHNEKFKPQFDAWGFPFNNPWSLHVSIRVWARGKILKQVR